MFHRSAQQSAFCAAVLGALAVKGEKRPVVCVARAGTGKTTSIELAVADVRAANPKAKILYLVFNKKNQLEAEKKLAKYGVTTLTLNAFGNRAVSRVTRVTVDGNGSYLVIDKAEAGLPRASRLDSDSRSDAHKALSLARAYLADGREDIEKIVADFGLGPTSKGAAEAFVDTLCKAMGVLAADQRSVIDYDDQIWLPVYHGLRVDQFDAVFVDEAQDLSPAKLALARMAVKEDGLFVAVGDDRQAIYGFAGADPDSLPRIIRETDAEVLPLTVTYRCPKQVVALAQGLVGDYTAHESAPEGIVREIGDNMLVSTLVPGDTVVSRSNAPLVSLCLRLLAAGTSAKVLGRADVADGLKKLVKKAKTDDVGDLLSFVCDWADKEVMKLSKAGRPVDLVCDKRDCLVALADGVHSVEELLARIDRLFTDAQEGRLVLLTSTHKAKGLEWDRVFLLKDTYRADKSPDPQEANLLYVAITRAKCELVLVRGEKRASGRPGPEA